MVMAGTLLATTIPFAGSAMAETEVITGDGLVPTVRFAGENRFDTAQLIATENTGFEAAFSGDAMIVATGDRFPDALAGSSLGGAEAAPIVLTPSTTAITPGELDEDLVEAIEGVDPETIYILGETEAVSAEIESLIDTGYDAAVTRIGGENRYETAALLARERADELAASAETRTAIVARADEFPDALVAGAIAAATSAGDDPAPIPILLTDTSGPVNPFTADVLADLDIERVIIAGGEEAISAEVATELGTIVGSEPDRVFGPNRYSTAAAFATLAEVEFDDAGFGFGSDHVNLATGENFPDALALGPHAGLDIGGPAPILLTEGEILGEPATAYLESFGDCDYNNALHVAGGPVAVPDSVVEEAREALTAVGDACAITLAPETATNLVGETHTVTAAVVDNAGDPVDQTLFDEPVTVTFTTAETGTAQVSPETATVEVAADGTATFSFMSNLPGDVTVTAEVTDTSGVVRSATATKTFALPAAEEAVFGIVDSALAPTTLVSGEDASFAPTATTVVAGIPVGDTVVGIDFRPVDRRLYALTDTGGLYVLTGADYDTAVAVGPGLAVSGADFTAGVGFDFNPDIDRIRVVTADGTNLVVDPTSGAIQATQHDVSYGPGDDNEGRTPAVTAASYAGVEFGDAETATAAALWVLDTDADVLARQSAAPDTAGQLTTVGDLTVGDEDLIVDAVNGFDISGNTGIAYAALDPEGEGSADLGLYVLDLTSGAAARVDDLLPELTAIAVAPRITGETAFLLEDDGEITQFRTTSADDGPVTRTVTGVTAATTLVALDYRDADGALYALGSDGQVYRMAVPVITDLTPMIAEPVGDPLALGDLATEVGLDVNPVVDLLRVVTGEGGNYRLDPESGTVVSEDIDLAYAADDENAGDVPRVTAAAYTGASGASSTTLFGLDTAADRLVTQTPANDGALTTVGDLGLDAGDVNGFDVSGVSGDAFAALESPSGDGLYRIDLLRGGVSFVGALPADSDVTGLAIVPEFDADGVFDVALSTAEQVPPVTESTAMGTARLRINTDTQVLCSTIVVTKEADDGTFAGSPGAHIHEAPRGENGPIVLPLPTPSDIDPTVGTSGGCVEANGLLDFAELVDAPEDYYVNVHTTEYPAGLVRGQLG
jgi:putative cell wall-binding protein